VKIDKIEITQLKVWLNPAALWGEETESEKPFRAGWCFFRMSSSVCFRLLNLEGEWKNLALHAPCKDKEFF
jgi:hypothetical protein